MQPRNKEYTVGLLKEEGLFLRDRTIIAVSKLNDGNFRRTECNLLKKMVKIMYKGKWRSFCFPPNSDNNVVIDLPSEGLSFEGYSLSNSLFGYGTLINEDNDVIYQGILVNKKKECFGTEFYPNLGIVEYCGCFWNNKRHGYGMLYDRKG